MLSDLLLDVRFHIASFDEKVWYLFYKHFDDFKLLTFQSRSFFWQLFTKKHLCANRIEYSLLGYVHCNSGPAVIYNNRQEWYQNGKLHRDDGPAIIYHGGAQLWYQHGRRHRDDGPAVVYASGGKEWYQRGTRVY